MPQKKSTVTQLKPALQRCTTESIGVISFDRARKAFPVLLSHEQETEIPDEYKFNVALLKFRVS